MLRPTDEAELADLLAAADAAGRRIAVRGGRTKASFAADADGEPLVVSALDRLVALEPGDFVCVAQAGMRLADLHARLDAEPGHRQRLMLDPPHGADATLGGILATNVSGPLRHRYGAPRDLIIGARFVLADGTRAKTGGRVVKNVAGYDLARLLCGSRGSLAVLTEVAFRLHPVAEASVTVVCETRDADRAAAFAATVRTDPLTPTVLDAHWPEGIVVVRFDSTADGARQQAALVDGGRILDESETRLLASRFAGRPWQGAGTVVGIGVPLTAVPEVLRLAERHCADLALRIGVGVGEARLHPGEETAFVDGVVALGGHISQRRGAVSVPRPDPVALDLMRAVKERFDPRGTLGPVAA